MAYTTQQSALGLVSPASRRRLELAAIANQLPAIASAKINKEYADTQLDLQRQAGEIDSAALDLERQRLEQSKDDSRLASGLGLATLGANLYGGYKMGRALEGVAKGGGGLGRMYGDVLAEAPGTTGSSGLFTIPNLVASGVGAGAGYGLGKAIGKTNKAGMIGAGVGAIAAPLAYNYGPDIFKDAVGSVVGLGKDIVGTVSGWFSR